jgi:hypothetical protein
MPGSAHWHPFEQMWRTRLDVLNAWRSQKSLIILDRSHLSTLAVCYALDRIGREGAYEEALAVSRSCADRFNLVVLFDGPSVAGLSRRKIDQHVPEPWDNIEFLDALRTFYRSEMRRLYVGPILELGVHCIDPAGVIEREILRDQVAIPKPAPLAAQSHTSALQSAGHTLGLGVSYGPAFEVLGKPTMYFRQHSLQLEGDTPVFFDDHRVIKLLPRS